MLKHDNHGEIKRIPFLVDFYLVCYDGTILDKKFNVVSLDMFNETTNLNISDSRILTAITFQEILLPPAYWSEVKIESEEGNTYPESFVISYSDPIESLEFPGFYVIPYYSNYVISKQGRLIKKSDGIEIMASRSTRGHFTFRMTDDSGKTQNFLRHRILAYAFLTMPFNFETLTVNHLNGIPGSDDLSNLEWATYAENNLHAIETDLRKVGAVVNIEAYDRVNDRYYLFPSCRQAAKFFNVSGTTIIVRSSSNGNKVFNGYQFRVYNGTSKEWPVVNNGNFKVILVDGTERVCDSLEAARHMNMTKTSLMRLLRNGKDTALNGVKIVRLNQSPLTE